jgi:hypothetical protein
MSVCSYTLVHFRDSWLELRNADEWPSLSASSIHAGLIGYRSDSKSSTPHEGHRLAALRLFHVSSAALAPVCPQSALMGGVAWHPNAVPVLYSYPFIHWQGNFEGAQIAAWVCSRAIQLTLSNLLHLVLRYAHGSYVHHNISERQRNNTPNCILPDRPCK